VPEEMTCCAAHRRVRLTPSRSAKTEKILGYKKILNQRFILPSRID